MNIDCLKEVVKFLDMTCDMKTFDDLSNVLKLTPDEKNQILTYWESKTITKIVKEEISIKRYVNGKLHSTCGPAIVYDNGDREWWQNGKLHRRGGPAIEFRNGKCEWYANGVKHRNEGPAVIWFDGAQEWWYNGVHHRGNDLPAFVSDTLKEWWLYGKKHRSAGPAVEWSNGDREWWIQGRLDSCDNHRSPHNPRHYTFIRSTEHMHWCVYGERNDIRY